MTDTFSKKSDAFLSPKDKDLGFIFDKIKQLNTLNKHILPLLDQSLQDYCQVANLTNGKLVLITANGSVATQIRFQTAELLSLFKRNPLLSHIRSIHCKMQPGFHQRAQKKELKAGQSPSLLSPASAEIVSNIAESLRSPQLQAVMKRIASRKSK